MAANKYADLAKKLHDRGLELDTQLRNLTKVNADLIIKCENCLTCLKEITGSDALAAKIACSVCCNNERTHVFLPCGHGGYCEACATRGVRRNRCFTCRAEIQSTIRVYL